MPKTLGTLVWLILFLLFVPNNWASAQAIKADIRLAETLEVDPVADFQVTPRSFCMTQEDNLFLFADYKAGTIKILGREGDSLKFLGALGRNGLENGRFNRPMYCFYNQNSNKLGVIDFESRWIYTFERTGKLDFTPGKDFKTPYLGYDIEFTESGDQVVIPAYLTNAQKKPFDLYSINLSNEKTNYLLPSPLKYNLKDDIEFNKAYFIDQELPAIGVRAYVDISGDDLYFVWEGALRIIKFDLKDREVKDVFTPSKKDHLKFYTKPEGGKFAMHYRKGEFEIWREKIKAATSVTNVFATSQYVYLFYMIGDKTDNSSSKMRMQVYSLSGNCLTDMATPGQPGKQMCFDKSSNVLYALSATKNGTGAFTVLKYTISIQQGNQSFHGQ